jgi:plasmid stabilization system protein ParE
VKRKILFSKNAQQSLGELLDYLQFGWSEKVKNKFILKLDEVIFLIQNDPDIFPRSEFNKKYHKCVLSKQTTIYYKFNDKEVMVLALFDTRQDPNKIKKIE